MRVKILSLLLFASFLFLPGIVSAHPGNTSSDGCHYCRTNCSKWGYTYGTRHRHYGNSCNCNPPVDPLYCDSNQTSNKSQSNMIGYGVVGGIIGLPIAYAIYSHFKNNQKT